MKNNSVNTMLNTAAGIIIIINTAEKQLEVFCLPNCFYS
jgi:hypothetical protein